MQLGRMRTKEQGRVVCSGKRGAGKEATIMNWTEVKIYTTSEGIEPLTGNLLSLGIQIGRAHV